MIIELREKDNEKVLKRIEWVESIPFGLLEWVKNNVKINPSFDTILELISLDIDHSKSIVTLEKLFEKVVQLENSFFYFNTELYKNFIKNGHLNYLEKITILDNGDKIVEGSKLNKGRVQIPVNQFENEFFRLKVINKGISVHENYKQWYIHVNKILLAHLSSPSKTDLVIIKNV